VVSRPWVPAAGDIITINFNPQSGYEQAGQRPGLVISEATYNSKAGLALICPITNQVKGYPFEVAIPPGQKITGVVLADQLKCLDWKSRQAKPIAVVGRVVLAEVRQRLRLILGIK
jgi:mRNA interferase MazF